MGPSSTERKTGPLPSQGNRKGKESGLSPAIGLFPAPLVADVGGAAAAARGVARGAVVAGGAALIAAPPTATPVPQTPAAHADGTPR